MVLSLDCLTCSDYNSLHHFTGIEAGLDDMRATEQGVLLMFLQAVAHGGLLS